MSLVFFTACSLAPVNEPTPIPLTLPILKDFESGGLSGFYPEVPSPTNVQLIADPVFAGSRAVKLTVAPGETVNHGNRAELAMYNVAQWDSTVFFGWRFFIPLEDPQDFQWQILAQWYQLPDFQAGENFDWFFVHPPLVFTQTPGFVEVQGSVGGEKTLGKVPLTRGVWHSVVFEILFRDDDKGWVQTWVDGQPITPFNGQDNRVYRPTLYNKAGAYFKMGLYRGAPDQNQAPSRNSVVIDNLAVGRSFGEVLP